MQGELSRSGYVRIQAAAAAIQVADFFTRNADRFALALSLQNSITIMSSRRGILLIRYEAAGQRIKMNIVLIKKRSPANIGPNYYLDIH